MRDQHYLLKCYIAVLCFRVDEGPALPAEMLQLLCCVSEWMRDQHYLLKCYSCCVVCFRVDEGPALPAEMLHCCVVFQS